MYKNLIYFQDLHVLSKVISIIFVGWSVILIQNSYLLIFMSCLFFFLFRNTRTFLFSLLFFFLSFWFPNAIVLMKLVMIFSYFSLFLQTISFSEIRRFLEYFFYRQKHSKIIYFSLYFCYFWKYYFHYFKEFYALKKSYGQRFRFSFLKYVFVQSFDKTKNKIHKVLLSYQYRFYNFMNRRNSVEDNKIHVVDLKYISTVVIIFFMIYLYWR